MSATRYPLPEASKIKQILGLLFDGLDVKPGGRLDCAPSSGAYVGVYVCDDGAPVALCACDADLAAYWGSALSMLPPALARDAAQSRQLTELMVGNLREIMNICTRLVMCERSPHLRLGDIYPVNELPGEAATLMGTAPGRSDFQIGLRKYGQGQLALLST